MRLRLGKVTVADVLAAQPVTTNLLKFMRASIKLCRLDTPIIFIEARINLSRFVVTGCAAKTSATVTFPSQIGRASCRERVEIEEGGGCIRTLFGYTAGQ